ncbi:MAG: peptidoglycan DD-metalloendopeptidase family protein [bacterium]
MIWTVKTVLVLKKILTVFFVWIIFKPLYKITHFIFYAFVVKFYGLYISFVKKIGWTGFQKNPLFFLLKEKLVHSTVVFIVFVLIFINFSSKTEAENLVGEARQTIIADLVKNDFSIYEEDQKLLVETFDSEFEISDVQQSYLNNLSSVKPNQGISLDEEEEDWSLKSDTGIVRPDTISTKISIKPRKEKIIYTVQGGDTISTIAENFGISVSTILWENNLSAHSLIRPGDELGILQGSGVVHTVARGENLSFISQKYDVSQEEILDANNFDGANLKIGQELFIPGGRKEYAAPAPVKKYTAISAFEDIIDLSSAKSVQGNKMAWPTVGSRITQYYSWKHYAIDIGNKTGTPIYAADSGTIEIAGWGTGYGNQIVINHGGGKKTRYGHLSKFYVKRGERVTKGQAIGAMGSTGWSTGPHLHFEVIINGKKYNPLNYIK